MLFQGMLVSVSYKRIDELKKIFFNNEKLLKNYFNEATVLPIPDDASLHFPRIITTTLHEHAQLSISPVTTTFEVFYNEGYEKSWAACFSYLINKISKVFDFLDKITDQNYNNIGVISNVVLDEIQENARQKLLDVLFRNTNIRNIYGIDVKYTFIEKDNFFVNINLQNVRKYKENINPDLAGSLSDSNQVIESIGAIIDVNDKYGFNSYPNYKSKRDNLSIIMDIMSEIINKKLISLVERGEYSNA